MSTTRQLLQDSLLTANQQQHHFYTTIKTCLYSAAQRSAGTNLLDVTKNVALAWPGSLHATVRVHAASREHADAHEHAKRVRSREATSSNAADAQISTGHTFTPTSCDTLLRAAPSGCTSA